MSKLSDEEYNKILDEFKKLMMEDINREMNRCTISMAYSDGTISKSEYIKLMKKNGIKK